MSIFLAHNKQVEDAVIDGWAEGVAALWRCDVVPGRDDYTRRARAMGGWNTWVREVPVAEDWSGSPLFSAIVVPVHDFDQPPVGRATFALVEGFLLRGKPAWAWNPVTNQVATITGVEDKGTDTWTDVGVLHIKETT